MNLHDLRSSGNCYKIRLFAGLAGIDLKIIPVDFAGGAHRRPPLWDYNPWCELPVLSNGPDIVRDAQAILVYLAGREGGLAWWPAHAEGQAEVMQWLSFTCNEIQHSLCAARLALKFGMDLDRAATLALLEQHLARHDWLALGRPTIAECAVYPYVHLAPEGGISLEGHPQLLAWMARLRQLPGFVGP